MNLFTSPAAAPSIDTALRQASAETGVGFDYLFKTAYRESSLDPQARAPTSSATGLFQFIESTWLSTLKEEGAKFGLGRYARMIHKGPDGRYGVADPQARAEILALRTDPKASALMAGALTQRNGEHLHQLLGREPSGGELYIAHFLGSGEAGRLVRMAETSPGAPAADAFPRAAQANRSIFHGPGGAQRTVAQVRDQLISMHGAEGEAGGLSRLVSSIERKVTSLFSSLFQFSAGGREPDLPAIGAAIDDNAGARRRGWEAPLSAPTPSERPMTEASERLSARAAYQTQAQWFALPARPEAPVFGVRRG